MKKFSSLLLITLIATAIGFFVMFVPNEDGEYIWNPFDYARITEVDYNAIVVDEDNSNGKVIITEQLTFEIHAASKSNPFYELWRDLPDSYVDGVKVDYNVISVKQIFEDGSELVYQESSKLYWEDYDYAYGAGKWYHSEGPYNESLRQYECLLFYVDGLYRETVVFEIEYEMSNAALRYNDSSELYLSMYSENTINYLTSFKGQILIPNEIMPSSGNYYANTYGTNSHSFAFTESSNINPGYYTFTFELNDSQLHFKPYNQYIEFALVSYGEDKHIFTQHASRNTYYNDNVLTELQEEQAEYDALPSKWRKIKAITLLLSSFVTCLTIAFVFFIIKKIKKKHTFYEPSMQIDYFRDIPSDLDPSFAAELAFCKNKPLSNIDDKYAATMLSLVHKGYIELERINSKNSWNYNNMKIIIKYNPTSLDSESYTTKSVVQQQFMQQPTNKIYQQHIPIEEQGLTNVKPLTPTEEQYFNLILRHSKGVELTLRSLQHKISEDYEYTNAFVKNIKASMTKIGISQGYYQKAKYKKPIEQAKRWSIAFSIIGILLMSVGNFVSYHTRLDLAFGSFFILGIGYIIGAIYLYKKSKKFILLTQFGEDEYAKWRGLYNFLNSETLMNEKTAIEIVIWEHYLIYATAFGISEKVIKALQIRCPNANTSPILSNPYYRSRTFRSGRRAFRTATRNASFTSRMGGHGGYGGGGRGGGGGGGGH